MTLILARRVNELLSGLGDTPGKVYKNLRKQEVTGRPGTGRMCPVANYLARELFDGKRGAVYVGMETVRVYLPDAGAVMEKTPEAVKEFIYRFDQKKYPKLIDNPGSTGLAGEPVNA